MRSRSDEDQIVPIDDMRSDRDKLLEQMAAIARFGDRAFRAEDLQALLQEAVDLVAKGSGVDKAKILELQPDGETLLVRAGVGWKPGVVGRTVIGAGRRSGAGYALLTGSPAMSEDLQAESRYEIPDMLRQHDIRSAANVIITGTDCPFGVLEIDSTARRRFTEEDINFLQGYANLLAAAIHRLRTTERLTAVAEEHALLLRELQHRVKNNLQTITSIVRIQKALARNTEAQRGLETLMNRLTALSLVHKKLYAPDTAREIALNSYLEELCSNLVTAARLASDDIRLDLRLEEVVVSVDLASSLGLIVNEFMTNSMQHAFPSGRGTISVTLARLGAGEARLILADDGVGGPAPTKAKRSPGLGLQLMQNLVEQIGGRIEWRRGQGTKPGTEAAVTIPI